MVAGRTRGRETDERSVKQGAAPDPMEALSKALEIFDDEFTKLNIHGKIATISGHLGRIPKNGFNKFNNYPYVLESDLVEWVKYYLAAARILVYPESFRVHEVYTFDGVLRDGKQRDILTDNIVVYRVVDGRTGENFTFEVNGQGSDPRDKGSNKASTSAMKFAYMRLFNISSGEDAEGDEQGDMRAAMGDTKVDVTVGSPTTGGGKVERGGRQELASGAQIRSISQLSNTLELGGTGLVGVIEKVLGAKVELPAEEAGHSLALARFLKETKSEDAGKLILALDEMVRATKAGSDDGEPL